MDIIKLKGFKNLNRRYSIKIFLKKEYYKIIKNNKNLKIAHCIFI
jgi:hypothetical protein